MNDAQISYLSAADLAVLFNVPVRALLATVPPSQVPWEPPVEWMRTARRRAREAQAQTSSTDIRVCINYLRGLR